LLHIFVLAILIYLNYSQILILNMPYLIFILLVVLFVKDYIYNYDNYL